MKIIDLSHELNNLSPVYPGDKNVELLKVSKFEESGYNMYELKTNMHVSTHVETPMHMDNSNKFISKYLLEEFIGKAKVLNFKDEKIINWSNEFDSLIEENDIVIIYTGFDKKYYSEKYYSDHPVLSLEFVNKIIFKKIKLIGIDFPSPDYIPYKIHNSLFKNNIKIVENLKDVDKLLAYKNIMFFAAPIKLDAESSLTRAFAICFD